MSMSTGKLCESLHSMGGNIVPKRAADKRINSPLIPINYQLFKALALRVAAMSRSRRPTTAPEAPRNARRMPLLGGNNRSTSTTAFFEGHRERAGHRRACEKAARARKEF